MAHAWAPPIDTLTLFDITGEGQPAVVGQEPPECQICMERLYNPELFPSEIATCHHRFHRDCLRNQWCNNNAGNTLAACRCPTCQQIFNCNTQLQDLTPQVNARLQELQPPAEAEGVQVEQPEAQVQQIPENNLQTYTRQNYLIDRAKKRFTDCITQIFNDCWDSFPQMNIGGGNIENLTEQNRSCIFFLKENQRLIINDIIDNFKTNSTFRNMYADNIQIFNTINARLQNQEFVQSLYNPRSSLLINTRQYVENYAGPHQLGHAQGNNHSINMLLQQCYQGENVTAVHQQWGSVEERNIAQGVLSSYLHTFFNSISHVISLTYQNNYYNFGNNQNTTAVFSLLPFRIYENLDNVHVYIDIQFFQRYFQCFLDFLTALLEVNYNQAFQLQGGKRSNRKTRNQKRNKKSKGKSKRRRVNQ